MTPRLFRFPLVVFLIFAFGLLVSCLIVFLGEPLAVYPPSGKYTFLPGPDPDSPYVLASPGAHYERGRIGEFFLGKHYRYLWTTPVAVPLLSLKERNLKVTKKGGGMQTTSFTLLHADGREFSLRSVDKDTKGVLPPFLRKTLITSFVRDQIAATDPYALLVVAALSRKAGLYQAEPEMVYILPSDPGFKAFGQVQGFYMLYPKDISGLKVKHREMYLGSFPTLEMQKLTQKPRATIAIDTLAYLESRLFDLLISDWDRHPGQWDWLAFSDKIDTVFRPAPKDRDQAMGYYQDGVLPWLLTRPFAVRKITSFTHDYQDMKGALQNGSVLDKLILNKTAEVRFIAAAKQLKRKLPDKVIAEALENYPSEIRNKVVPLRYSNLVSRRNKLEEAAREFYEVLHEE